MAKSKQPIKRTALGLWLKEKAPKVAEIVGDVLPDAGALGIVRNLLKEHASPEVALEAEAYLERAKAHENEITKRWQADASGNLSANVRPYIVLGSCLCFVVFAVLDAFNVIVVKQAYINLLESLLMTSVGGYFVLRSADKWTNKKA